jgi:hypothetical protein
MSSPVPADGTVFHFRTVPYSEFAPKLTNRFGALKVLGSNEDSVVIAVLDFIGDKPPSLEVARACHILQEHRFSHTGRPAVWSVNADWWDLSDLEAMTSLGTIPVSVTERRLVSNIFDYVPGSVFSTLKTVNYAAEGEWRWANDRDAFIAEHEQKKAQEAAKRAAQEERYKNRLRGLTWEQLLQETPFERWSRSPPFPSGEFTRQARNAIHSTCRAIQALGSKPRKPDVRKLLRECVEWFNKADEEAGGVIETEEREDICAVLEEMAYVARQKSLVDEVDKWRDW